MATVTLKIIPAYNSEIEVARACADGIDSVIKEIHIEHNLLYRQAVTELGLRKAEIQISRSGPLNYFLKFRLGREEARRLTVVYVRDGIYQLTLGGVGLWKDALLACVHKTESNHLELNIGSTQLVGDEALKFLSGDLPKG